MCQFPSTSTTVCGQPASSGGGISFCSECFHNTLYVCADVGVTPERLPSIAHFSPVDSNGSSNDAAGWINYLVAQLGLADVIQSHPTVLIYLRDFVATVLGYALSVGLLRKHRSSGEPSWAAGLTQSGSGNAVDTASFLTSVGLPAFLPQHTLWEHVARDCTLLTKSHSTKSHGSKTATSGRSGGGSGSGSGSGSRSESRHKTHHKSNHHHSHRTRAPSAAAATASSSISSNSNRSGSGGGVLQLRSWDDMLAAFQPLPNNQATGGNGSNPFGGPPPPPPPPPATGYPSYSPQQHMMNSSSSSPATNGVRFGERPEYMFNGYYAPTGAAGFASSSSPPGSATGPSSSQFYSSLPRQAPPHHGHRSSAAAGSSTSSSHSSSHSSRHSSSSGSSGGSREAVRELRARQQRLAEQLDAYWTEEGQVELDALMEQLRHHMPKRRHR
ncbi:hypothetical protein GGR56DRAFT_148526 [Xylariaceae sp. FL0804]|nr:hypothetical protein GGR56DRAFT_148526 [Xylariaceae sp. FL0804]